MNFNSMQFAYVNGYDGARSYPLPMGSSALLMDTEKPLFYLKTCSNMGQYEIKTYEFKEIQTPKSKEEYITKQEFEELNRKIETLLSK